MRTLVIEYWLPVAVWLVVIFTFSTDAFSGGETSKIITPLLTFFFPRLSAEEIELWHGVIRKGGHVLEYFILTLFVYRSFKYGRSETVWPKIMTLAFVVIAAIADETHQGATVSRSASLFDVGYDSFGCLWALWLVTLYEARRLHPHSVL